ncbi:MULTISPECIES: heavy metal translocating P-type ATPase [Pontibacillus]|uniref:Heavy metal translocating P-type ATPase n=1 Tax=Pontibacillus chungwhensis TaxID=265426 RepID=A0ABY8UYM5_9BACI|nr:MULTISPECIES: heavy metal translocating P-type ATPase [Pontibacillus]MCD5325474.1 cadmium-translocating P-type ATPase [Pontibacillus sp. HN14]WIF98587.1 heavy metal translocating P-type ATPase [Pontibacillus chungwhensis]
MSAESKPMSASSTTHTSVGLPTFMNTLKEHGELIAAILSGIIILTAWLSESTFSQPVTVSLYVIAFIIGGFAKAKEGIEETIEDRDLNVEMLMIFAAIGSASIGYWTEGAVLIFIFAMSGALETYTMNKSQREISSLMDLQPEEALRVRSGKQELVHVSELAVGDHILVKAGERVPSDGEIIKGNTSLDEAAITGESVPVSKEIGAEVFAGTVNINGSITVQITKPSNETLFQKIIQLVQSAQSEKSPSQLFIERFEGTYVKVVLVAVALMMFIPHYAFGWSWQDTIYRAMILLVVASPCALVASIMPATLSAISNGARHGILFKGGVHLENLSHLQAIAFDKTGTLTNGKPVVTDTYFRSETEDLLPVLTSIERESNHPLAQAIVKYGETNGAKEHLEVFDMTDVSGSGVTAKVFGKEWKIGKAAFVGEEEAFRFQDGIAETLAKEGKTLTFIADEDGIAGLVALKDTIRQDTKRAIQTLRQNGIYTVMLTGDHETTAKAIAAECGIDNYVAECLPEDKVEQVKLLRQSFDQVAMVGDGINDAPALATANVGIAMGEGTDVALETADVVLMKNDLPKISNALNLSTKMNRIVKQNVIFSILVIMLLIISNFLQFLNLPLGVVGHEGSTILVILNGLRLLRS